MLGDKIEDKVFNIILILNVILIIIFALVRVSQLDQLRKECVERGIAHYNSSGGWELNNK